MVHLGVINLPELLEQILYFLLIDKSLYSALFVSRLWYRCGVPILWKRIELKKSNTQNVLTKLCGKGWRDPKRVISFLIVWAKKK